MEGEAEGVRGNAGPVLVRLQDSKQRLIFSSEGASKVRNLLLNLYERDLDSCEIKEIVQAVNSFFAESEQSEALKVSEPFYHPRFRNGRREYGKYNRPY